MSDLSAREHDILRRMYTGSSVSDIARALRLSVQTVSTYRARTFKKLGIKNPRMLWECFHNYANSRTQHQTLNKEQ